MLEVKLKVLRISQTLEGMARYAAQLFVMPFFSLFFLPILSLFFGNFEKNPKNSKKVLRNQKKYKRKKKKIYKKEKKKNIL